MVSGPSTQFARFPLSHLQLKVMVPWMHGFDHDLPCQIQNSGLYQVRLLLS